MEAAGRSVFDFPEAPWEFQLDMARQVWDESRHAEIYMKLLEYVGSYLGEFPESEVLWSCTQVDDPACRVAGINRGLEGLACDVFEQIIRLAQKMGDPVIERAVDYVLADEITHVRMGSQWMRKLTEGDPVRLKKAQDFQANIDNRCSTSAAGAPPRKMRSRCRSGWPIKRSISTRRSQSRRKRGCSPDSLKTKSNALSAPRRAAPRTESIGGTSWKNAYPLTAWPARIALCCCAARKAREIREEQELDEREMPFDEEALRARLHGIFSGEVQAMEAAGRTLFDFPDAPWEFQLDMARQVWDESRHTEIFHCLLEYLGG